MSHTRVEQETQQVGGVTRSYPEAPADEGIRQHQSSSFRRPGSNSWHQTLPIDRVVGAKMAGRV